MSKNISNRIYDLEFKRVQLYQSIYPKITEIDIELASLYQQRKRIDLGNEVTSISQKNLNARLARLNKNFNERFEDCRNGKCTEDWFMQSCEVWKVELYFERRQAIKNTKYLKAVEDSMRMVLQIRAKKRLKNMLDLLNIRPSSSQ